MILSEGTAQVFPGKRPMASRSARSFNLPLDTLFCTKSSSEMKGTQTPSHSIFTRRAWQALNSTPLADVMTSIRKGGEPIRKAFPGVVKNASGVPSGTPNLARAF